MNKENLNSVGLRIDRGQIGHVFKTGYEVEKNKGLALVWMSVGNSYFDREKIFQIVDFVKDHFGSVKFITPAEPAFYTYKGLGYDDSRASSKARHACNTLSHHIEKAINNHQNLKLVNWNEEISNNPHYLHELEKISTLYTQNTNFWLDADETTLKVLENASSRLKGKLKTTMNLNKGVEIGVNYLLKELVFVLASPEIYGVPQTAYIYHKRWPIFEKLVNGGYDGIIKEKNGFLLVN